MAPVGIRELLEAGVHFGHQTRRWNPKMRRFIYGERGGIYIIDLLKTERMLETAQTFASGVAARGGTVLFVGTKKQARDGIKATAEAAGMPYVNHRWLGGLLTNFQTMQNRIKRLHDLERYETEGQLQLLPTRERMNALADLEKLRANLGGVKHMTRTPDALFVIDLKTEAIAVKEAQRLRIPIIGLVDTNCDPDGITYVVPGNDDAIRACNVITEAIGSVITEGRTAWQAEEERRRAEEEARVRREAEERARREEEEKARRAAEEAARAQEAALTQTDTPDRGEAEAQVAEAATARPRAARSQGRRPKEAAAAVQAADEPAAAPTGNVGPGRQEEIVNPNVGDRDPQAAAAAAGAGAPASDTATPAPHTPDQVPTTSGSPDPGPSDVAAAAAEEAPPAEPDVEAPSAATPQAAAEEAKAEQAKADEPKADEVKADEAETGDDEDKGVVGTVVDTAQDAAGAVADTAQGAAGAVAGAVGGLLGAVADAVTGDDDKDRSETEKTTTDEDDAK